MQALLVAKPTGPWQDSQGKIAGYPHATAARAVLWWGWLHKRRGEIEDEVQ